MNEQQKQTILDLPKVIAVGIASPLATVLTSRFGVAGTLIGLALSAVIITVITDVLKVYLARAPATVAKVPDTVVGMPSGLRTRLSRRNIRSRLREAFARFSSLPPARRRSIMIGSIVAAGISCLVGLSIVTALELGVGKSLSCWVWDDCPTESSTNDGSASTTSTLPSILGGGRSANSVAPGVQPSPQQQNPGAPGLPSQPESIPPSSEQPSSSLQPGQRWSPSGAPEEGDQQPSSSSGSEEDEQRSSADRSEGDQQQEGQTNPSSYGSNRENLEPTIPSVPFST